MRALLVLTLVGCLVGCLEVPDGGPTECRVSNDCNTGAGEVCNEGVCYGNPPAGVFAATLAPPIDRIDIVSTEIPMLSISPDGWLGNDGSLVVEAPVAISGRVEAYCPAGTCPTLSIEAEVRVTRPSRFLGGPTLRLSTHAEGGKPRGTDTFTLLVPRLHPGDEPYVLTIDPEGGGKVPPAHGGEDPAQKVPPMRVVLTSVDNLEHQT